jgi:hypothetical protein
LPAVPVDDVLDDGQPQPDGIGLLEAGCPARAAARFRRATMLQPADPAAWINFSAALLALAGTRSGCSRAPRRGAAAERSGG